MFDQDENNKNINSDNEYNVYNEETNSYTWKPIDDDHGPDEPEKKRRDRKLNKLTTAIIIALIFGIVAGATTYGVNSGLNFFFPGKKDTKIDIDSTNVIENKKSNNNSTDGGSTTIVDVTAVVEEVMPSVVAITTTQNINSGSLFPFYGQGSNQEVQSGSGSGIIIGKNETELLIITSNHVVEDSHSVYIQFVNDDTISATVKAAKREEDLAIVSIPLDSIKAETLSQIKIAKMATDKVKVGEGAIAIGNALGYGQSVTTGVISALNREVTVEDLTLTLIQTDAAINPGNSGGALLNMRGEVIGINEAKFSSSGVEGMGFAIPISSKTDIINELVNSETRQRVAEAKKGYLGIYGRDVSKNVSETYNIPEGVYVVQLIENGAAKKAGIKEKDILTKFDGEPVNSMADLQDLLEYYEFGQTVTVNIMALEANEYVEKEIQITLSARLEEVN